MLRSSLFVALLTFVSAHAREETRQCEHAECNIEQYLRPSKFPAPGFHLACLTLEDGLLHVRAFKDSVRQNQMDFTVDPQGYAHVRSSLTTNLLISKKSAFGNKHLDLKQDWAMFAPDTRRIESIEELLSAREVFIIEGGQFMWPGVKIGHIQNHSLAGSPGVRVQLETVSLQPLVLEVKNFLSEQECQAIVQLAEPHMANSGVAHMDKDKGRASTDWRTSTQTFLSRRADPKTIGGIDKRVADLTGVALDHQEEVQVLRYRNGEFYDAHHDCFDPRFYSSQAQAYDYGHKNRLITVFWYMTDVPEGGATVFPRAGGLPPPRSNKDCTTGLKVRPEKGKVIIFYSLLPNGDIDDYSLHGGCPVEEGLKWAANKWVWNKPSGYYR